MKRLLILLFAALLGSVAGSLFAAGTPAGTNDEWQLTVGGLSPQDDAATIKQKWGIEYSASTRTLTFTKDCTYDGDGAFIRSYVDGMTIVSSASQVRITVTQASASAIVFAGKNTNVLNIGSGKAGANNNMYYEKPQIIIESKGVGIYGANNTLKVNTSLRVTAAKSGYSPIDGFGDVQMESNMGFSIPSGGYYSEGVRNAQGIEVTGEATVEILFQTTWPVSILGKQITNTNRQAIPGIDVTKKTEEIWDGSRARNRDVYTVSFDGSQIKELKGDEGIVFEHTSSPYTAFQVIAGGGSDIAINVKGCGILFPDPDYYGEGVYEDCVIRVNDNINFSINSEKDYAVKGGYVDLRGKTDTYGTINTKGAKGVMASKLAVFSTTMQCNVENTSGGPAISGLQELQAGISFPELAELDVPSGNILSPEGRCSKVSLVHEDRVKYPLTIAGIPLTPKHLRNSVLLSEDEKLPDGFTFHPSKLLLEMEDVDFSANMVGGGGGIVWTSDRDLDIKVIGEGNKMYIKESNSGIRSTANGKITLRGDGPEESSLSLDNEGRGIWANKDLTIRDLTLLSQRSTYGLVCDNEAETDGVLTIQNAVVEISCDDETSPIAGFRQLVLEDCIITEPAGAEYNGNAGGLELDGTPVTGFVRIQPSDSEPAADLNGDGDVNVGDVTTLVNMILGKDSKSDSADLNGDGDVNVGDVTTLVNIILGK